MTGTAVDQTGPQETSDFCLILSQVIREELQFLGRMVNVLQQMQDKAEADALTPVKSFPWVENSVACRFLGISKKEIARYRAKGCLPYGQIGRKIYYRRPDLEKQRELLRQRAAQMS